MATEIIGDLTTLNLAKNDYIVHQANCKTRYAAGLAKSLFDRFPRANVYKGSHDRIPGTCLIIDNIISLFGQDSGGKWKTVAERNQREQWFRSGLSCITNIINGLDRDVVSNIYFPQNIGCGMAGGKWLVYKDMIDKWVSTIDTRHHVFIVEYGVPSVVSASVVTASVPASVPASVAPILPPLILRAPVILAKNTPPDFPVLRDPAGPVMFKQKLRLCLKPRTEKKGGAEENPNKCT